MAAFGPISEGVRLSNSIDDFLDVHRANEYANRSGKAAIVKAILAAERSSDRLYYDRSNAYNRMDISRAEGTWIIKFVRMLGRNVPLADIKKVFRRMLLCLQLRPLYRTLPSACSSASLLDQ